MTYLRTWRKTCRRTTSSNTYFTWTKLGWNQGLPSKMTTNSRLSHGTAAGHEN